jgi:flavin-dependent dehydrogenase
MKITIVGGGTAGWLAAYYICSAQPGLHELTVIESSKIGIIGAGEGSTGLFTNVLNGHFFPRKVDLDNFINFCDATNKIGIKFVGWDKHQTSFFSPLDGSNTALSTNDILFKYVLSKFGNQKVHLASRLGVDFHTGKNYEVIDALHFNAHKVGEYFKDICISLGVSYYDAVVKNIIQHNETGNIISLVLDNNLTLEADLFIDCSGFNRILMNRLQVPWISYSKYLPLNSALPFLLEYQPNETIEPCTTATALSSGWMWDIPLKNRRGCGYVYNDTFISADDAKKELENKLKRPIVPIKTIKFDPGRSEVFWKKNVLCLGLASSFVEPLQATSIHTTLAQIILFVNDFLMPDKQSVDTEENKRSYNKRMSEMYDITLDFISLHYQGGRNDTPFWRWISEEKIVSPYVQDLIQRSKNKVVGHHEIGIKFGAPAVGLWNWTIAGLNLIEPKTATTDLLVTGLYDKAEELFINFISHHR